MLNSDDEEFNALKLMATSEVAKVRTSEVGSVVSYDHETQTATVQPIMQTVNNRGEYERQPAAKNIPVRFFDVGDWVICADIPEGTVGTIYYMERDMESWLDTGSKDIKPSDPRRFDVNDAFFVPGFRPKSARLGDQVARPGELTIGKSDGSVQIRLKSGEVIVEGASIKLGANATKLLALADKIDKFISLIDALLLTWTVVPADGAAALKAAWIAARTPIFGPPAVPIGSVATTKARGE